MTHLHSISLSVKRTWSIYIDLGNNWAEDRGHSKWQLKTKAKAFMNIVNEMQNRRDSI